MKMEVRIISRENVKPSYPKPSHPKTYKLSQLDTFLPPPYAPIILFYPAKETNDDVLDVPRKLDLLRRSLSETLTRFYPLAGKIKDELTIACDDGGAYFVETNVNITMEEFLKDQLRHDLILLQKFLPCDFFGVVRVAAEDYVTNIQVNVFECGGMVIGLCISHRMVDGSALSTFLRGWASIARGCHKEAAVYPKFMADSLFPANDLWLRDAVVEDLWGPSQKLGKCVTKRFVFDGSAISNLKAQATSSSVQCPTRVEAVSAFLWKSMMAASAGCLCGCPRKPSLVTHFVDLRRRVVDRSWEDSMGNLVWIVAAKYTATTASKAGLKDLVGEIRKANSTINDGFIKRMMIKGDEGKLAMSKSIEEIVSGLQLDGTGGVDCFGFSSWCKLGYYGTDFGWGKPVWVTPVPLAGAVVLNLVMLVDTRRGNGIEAWVSLDEQEMAVLERDPEILKLASIDPCPLQ